jgi:hypothetical protein
MQSLVSLWCELQAAQQRLRDTFSESRMPARELTSNSLRDSFKKREYSFDVGQAASKLMRWVSVECYKTVYSVVRGLSRGLLDLLAGWRLIDRLSGGKSNRKPLRRLD